ncbi:dehydrogenase [Streptomyces sp. NPDC060205]|uniref:dehydrogenase n=1 Tax=Streptomyces sp. NPDC060205 TaxID=3347072 RepID=UPI0036614559
MSSEAAPFHPIYPVCPECSGQLRAGGMLLCRREDDGRRACRQIWACAGQHVWWRWSDRPADDLEHCPHPQLFGD